MASIKLRQTLLLGLLFLLPFLLLPLAAEFNTDETNERMSELSRRTSIGGLQGWANMGAGIRNTAVKGYPDFGSILGNGGFDYQALIKYITGAIVLLGLCIVFAVLTLIVCPCFYCCRACGNCGGDKPAAEGYTQNQIRCALITMGIGLTLVAVGFIIGLVANSVLDRGVNNMQFVVQEIIEDVLDLPDEFQSTFGNIVDQINVTVFDLIDLVRSIPESIIGPDGTLSLLVDNTTDRLVALQIVFDSLLSKAASFDNLVNTLVSDMEQMRENYTQINSDVTDLTVDVNYNGNDYKFNASCLSSYETVVVVNVTGLFPNFVALLDDVSSVNLTQTSADVKKQFDTISQNATALIDEQVAGIKNQVQSFVDTTQQTLDVTVNSTLGDTLNVVKDYQAQTDEIIQKYVAKNNSWRNIIMAVLFALNMVAVLLCLLGLLLKKSWIMTCSAVFSFFLIITFWVLCALHLIVAAPSGKICEAITERKLADLIPPELVGIGGNRMAPLVDPLTLQTRAPFDFNNCLPPLLTQSQDLGTYLDVFYDTLDKCHAGGNLVEILNLTACANMTGLVDEFLGDANLTSYVTSIDFEELVGNVDFTAGLNLTQLTGYLQYLDSDYDVYINLFENLAFKPVVATSNTSKNALQALRDDTALLESCLVGTNSSGALPDAEARLDTIITHLTSLESKHTDIQNGLNSMRANLQEFATFANESTVVVVDIFYFVDSLAARIIEIGNTFQAKALNETIPQGLDLIYSTVRNIEVTIIHFTNCTWIADDALGLINSICVDTVSGLDAVWVTSGFLSIMLLVSIVGITLTAKRYIRADAMEQEFGEDYYQQNEFELPPMYPGSSDEKATY